MIILDISPVFNSGSPGRVAQSVGHLSRNSEVLGSTWCGHILSFLLPLIQEGQLSVTGESMCTKYWPGRVAQLVGHLTRKSGVLGSIPSLAT